MFKVEYELQTFHSVRERTKMALCLISYFFYIIDFSKSCICYEINANKEVIESELFRVFCLWFFRTNFFLENSVLSFEQPLIFHWS